MSNSEQDGPIGISISHRRYGGWNRHEVLAQKFVEAELNQIVRASDVGLSAYKEINISLVFSDRNGERRYSFANRIANGKVELDWRDKVGSDSLEMELFIAKSACSLLLDIITMRKIDPGNFLSAVAKSSLPANLVDQLSQPKDVQLLNVADAKSEMTEELFWDLIEETRAKRVMEHAKNLTKRLLDLKPREILDFEIIQNRQLAKAYTWVAWAIAYMAYGGCSDDGFADFRGWMLTLGKKSFDQSIEDPQFLADQVSALLASNEPANEREYFLFAAAEAHEEKTGWSTMDLLEEEELFFRDCPTGQEWDEDKVCIEFPQWCAQFGHKHES